MINIIILSNAMAVWGLRNVSITIYNYNGIIMTNPACYVSHDEANNYYSLYSFILVGINQFIFIAETYCTYNLYQRYDYNIM